MEKLLSLALKKCCDAEAFQLNHSSTSVFFANGRLKDVTGTMQSGTSLRIIKDGMLGFAYTRKGTEREEEDMVGNALASLHEGVKAEFGFPRTPALRELDTYDRTLEDLSGDAIAAECERVISFLGRLTDAQLDVSVHKQVTGLRVMNSAGTDLRTRSSFYYFDVDLIYPGGHAGISHALTGKKFEAVGEPVLRRLADTYQAGRREVAPPSGRMKVLFMPNAMYALLWRIKSAVNCRSIYKKESPLDGKLGAAVYDPKFTAYDDPLDDRFAGARSFDDEAVACRKLDIVSGGVLRNFYCDLNYASKMKALSTGHGYRSSMWSVDPITTRPGPCLNHFFIRPGDQDLDQLISAMDRGIIIHSVLGAHSGNIPNGDFSVGLAPGLYVEKGEIRGRARNVMITGNVHELLKSIIGIENAAYPAFEGQVPAILFESATVAVR